MHRILWKTCCFHCVAEDYVRKNCGSEGCMERVHGPTTSRFQSLKNLIFFKAFQENHDFTDF